MQNNLLSLLDLTSLNETDTEENIIDLCKKAVTPLGAVAAICIYPQFVNLAKKHLQNSAVKIATVANFPTGDTSLENVTKAIKQSIVDGADEIDVVFPYKRYLHGETKETLDFVRECKGVCGKNILLKVILETGVLKDANIITDVSRAVLQNGGDFIKTATGKIQIGATIPAATAMLNAIKELTTPDFHPGFKAAGGIRTIEQANEYIELAKKIMGANWVNSKTFRIGASKLVDEILNSSG